MGVTGVRFCASIGFTPGSLWKIRYYIISFPQLCLVRLKRVGLTISEINFKPLFEPLVMRTILHVEGSATSVKNQIDRWKILIKCAGGCDNNIILLIHLTYQSDEWNNLIKKIFIS